MDIHSAVLQRQLQAEIAAERARVIAESNRDEHAANVHAATTWSSTVAGWMQELGRMRTI
jgi:hypothetical protein